MKKIKSLVLTAFILALLMPSQIFAATLEIEEVSSSSSSKMNINVKTEGGLTKEIVAVINYSDDVTISDVTAGTVKCSALKHKDTDGVLTITCPLETEIAVDGAIAQISFTSTGTDYKFTIDNALTTISGITFEEYTTNGNKADTTATTTTTTEGTEETSTINTSTENTSTTEKSSSYMDYLPYILIAGSAILLISIVGILITSRKKVDTEGPVDVSSANPNPSMPTEPTTASPTMQDINSLSSQPTMDTTNQTNGVGTTSPTTPNTNTPINTFATQPATSVFPNTQVTENTQAPIDTFAQTTTPMTSPMMDSTINTVSPETQVSENPATTPAFPETQQEVSPASSDTMANPMTTPLSEPLQQTPVTPVETPTMQESVPSASPLGTDFSQTMPPISPTTVDTSTTEPIATTPDQTGSQDNSKVQADLQELVNQQMGAIGNTATTTPEQPTVGSVPPTQPTI